MLTDMELRLGVCPVCEEVFAVEGDLPICENCLARLDRWAPEDTEVERLAHAA